MHPRLSDNLLARTILSAGLIALTFGPATAARAADISADQVAEGVYLFQGAGSNVVAMADGADLLVIDGGLDANSADLYAAIREATGGQRIATLIDTHWHPEQVGLNDEAGQDGATIIAHEQTHLYLSHEVTSPLYDSGIAPLDEAARPNSYDSPTGELTFAGHTVQYGYLPAAHTNGDLYVFFPDLNVMVAGGAVGSDSWPLLDYWNGGLIGGLVRAHETLAEMVNDETIVIPAHGPAITGARLKQDVATYQQLFRDLNWLMNKGMGYNDVVDLNPLQGREGPFGDPSQFLDGAYRSKQMTYVPD
jgi:glyoxylase-like metal-dependent hydrolase (beta-lactamase superfamily II)